MRNWALMWMIALASCSDMQGRSESDDDRPFAKDRNAVIAAKDCAIEEWHWAEIFAFDGPQPEEPHFGYEIESLPSEEITAEKGRSWDRTERIEAINACIYSSFEKQGVRVGLAAPALVETVIGKDVSEGDSK